MRKPIFYHGLIGDVPETKVIAAFAIRAAKDHVNGCGGPTQLWVLDRTGIDQNTNIFVKEAELTSEELFQSLKDVMLSLNTGNLESDDDVKKITNLIAESVSDFRDAQRRRIKKQLRLAELRQKHKAAATQPTP